MNLQFRIIAALLLLAVIAIGTGSVLLLGYLLAASSIGVILFLIARKVVRRLDEARLSRPRLFSRSLAATSRTSDESERRAA